MVDITELNKELLTAIDNNNLEQVKSLVEQGADIDVKDLDGDTSLIYAVKRNDLNLVKILIENGADVNGKDANGVTPLIIAAHSGNLVIIQYLIEHGADVNVRDMEKCYASTPLFWATYKGYFEIAKLLIDNGADVNARDNKNYTYLMFACNENHFDIVKLLIEHGADVNAKNEHGSTAIMCAAHSGNLVIIQYLIEHGADVDVKSSDGKTPLIFSYTKDIVIQKFLIEAMKKIKDPQLIERNMPLMNVDYSDFNQLKNKVEKLNKEVERFGKGLIKTMDLSLALQKKVSDIQEDSFLNAQLIEELIKKENEEAQQNPQKEIESLWKYVETMSNHIKELENKQKGFIRRFFDRFRLIKRDDLDIKKHKSRQSFTLNDD